MTYIWNTNMVLIGVLIVWVSSRLCGETFFVCELNNYLIKSVKHLIRAKKVAHFIK